MINFSKNGNDPNLQNDNRKFFMTLASFLLIPLALVAIAVSIDIKGTDNRSRAATTTTADVTITVDLGQQQGISLLDTGVTHTQYSLDSSGNATAIESAKTLLRNGVTFANQHIFGWGAGAINPAPGVYDFSSLDKRVQMMRETGNKMVITFCCGPTWMTDPNWTSGTDWTKLEWAVLPEHENDYAQLAKTIAQRYPDVEYFQVWNEMKGFWNSSINNWDYVRYTNIYNQIWDAVKSVRPDSKIGGPYLPIEGSGGTQDLGLSASWYTKSPITDRNKEVLVYWLANKRGADFITIDRNSIDGDPNWSDYSEDKRIKLTHWFEDIAVQIKSLPGYNNEPLWYAEDYIWKNSDANQPTTEYQNATLASMLLHELKGGVAVSLRWGPQQHDPDPVKENLFTDTAKEGGGQALPAYDTYKKIHDYFPPGTNLYKAESSSPDIEVVSGTQKTIVINKWPIVRTVDINGTVYQLNPYEVKAMDLPPVLPTYPPTQPASTVIPSTFVTPTPSLSSDTVQPQVSIIKPTDGSTVVRRKKVAIEATASDNSGVTKTEFYINSTLLCRDPYAPYTCVWNVPGKAGIRYTITAVSYDSAGNSGQSQISVTSN